MLSYSDKLKEIKIRYVLLIFVLVYAIIIMFAFFDIWISEDLPYILVTAYILYNLKDYFYNHENPYLNMKFLFPFY